RRGHVRRHLALAVREPPGLPRIGHDEGVPAGGYPFVVSRSGSGRQALGLRPWLAALPLRERRLRPRLLMRSSSWSSVGPEPVQRPIFPYPAGAPCGTIGTGQGSPTSGAASMAPGTAG